jgi:hypothetical protein
MTNGIFSAKSRVSGLSALASSTSVSAEHQAEISTAFEHFLMLPKAELATTFRTLSAPMQQVFAQLATHVMHDIQSNMAAGGDSKAIAEDIFQTIGQPLQFILGSVENAIAVVSSTIPMVPTGLESISIAYRSESMVGIPLTVALPAGEALDAAIRENATQVLKQLAAMPMDIVMVSTQSKGVVDSLRCRNDVMRANRLLHEALDLAGDDDRAMFDAFCDQGTVLKNKLDQYDVVRHARPIAGFTELLDEELSWQANFEGMYVEYVGDAEVSRLPAVAFDMPVRPGVVHVADIMSLDVETVLKSKPHRSTEGTDGVQMFATAYGSVVIKQTEFVREELTANIMASRLGLPVPAIRAISMSKPVSAAFLSQGLKAEPSLMMAFVPGANLEYVAPALMHATFNDATHEGLAQISMLGRTFAFDLFIANRDRFPAALNIREILGDLGVGNSGNVMVTPDQRFVAIDQVFGLSQLAGKDADYLAAAGKLVVDIVRDTKEGCLALAGIAGLLEAFGGPAFGAAGMAALRGGFVAMTQRLAECDLAMLMADTPHVGDAASRNFLQDMQRQFSRNLMV